MWMNECFTSKHWGAKYKGRIQSSMKTLKSIWFTAPLSSQKCEFLYNIYFRQSFRLSESSEDLTSSTDLLLSYFFFTFSESCLCFNPRWTLPWSPRGALSFLCTGVPPSAATTSTPARWNASSSASSPSSRRPSSSPRAASLRGHHAASRSSTGSGAQEEKHSPAHQCPEILQLV